MMQSNCGIFYVATGRQYIEEACRNALLCKSFDQSISISLCTDQHLNISFPFDHIIHHPEAHHSYRDKIVALSLSPYRQTLFLDSDAFCSYHLDDLFAALSTFDLAAAPAPVRHPPGFSDSSVPLLFTEFNTGVIYFLNNHLTAQLFSSWLSLYDEWHELYDQQWDQASFRSVLWRSINYSSLRFLTLPNEYNLRTTKPWIAGRGLPVYFIHGRFHEDELDSFVHFLNDDIDKFRTYSHWLEQFPHSSIRPRFDRTFN